MIDRRPEFFFDTADTDKALNVWGKLKSHVARTSVLGFTTNPNALHEAGIETLLAMEERLKIITQVTTEIRGDDKGIVYVQVPNSRMSLDGMQQWINYIRSLGDGKTRIAIKLPPQINGLLDDTGLTISRVNPEMMPNITGVADSATAVKAFEQGQPAFVSLIWGRMMGLTNPRDEFSWTEKQRQRVCPEGRIIAGSLRDLETLKGAIETGAVPTIGFKFWDQVGDKFTADDFVGLWNSSLVEPPMEQPLLVDGQIEISRVFFTQMDDLGKPLYDEFRSNLA